MFNLLKINAVLVVSKINPRTIIWMLFILAIAYAALAHSGAVLAEPVWGGSVGR